LISCGSQSAESPTPGKTESPIVSSTPTVAPTATFTSLPTLELPTTPTAIPIKSSLGTDRWQVVDIPLVMETPLPIPTPSVDATAYRLRTWDEETALSLIRTAEEFSFADNIPFPPNDSRYNYLYDQVAVKLAIQEALHRYPQTRFAKQLEWRIALANTIMGQAGLDVDNAETDIWILRELENGLNDGLYTPDDLTQMLNPHGFTTSLSDAIPNLQGRNQSGQILRIYWVDNESTSLYAALGKDREGHYQLFKIYSDWNFTHDFDQSYVVEDHTGDRVPEIIFTPYYYNGSWCGYERVIYQWHDGQFADLSQDQFHFDDCSPIPGTWKYGSRDAKGAESLITREPIGYYSYTIQVKTYKWNGDWYELAETYVEPPDQINEDTAEWPVFSMGEQAYSTLTKNIPTYLSTPSKLSTGVLGPSYRDYLAFQLGIA
jgi:hypothetical protein